MSVLKSVRVSGLGDAALLIGLAAGMVSGSAQAQTPLNANPACARPATPACIDDLTTYVSADKMIACQNAVQDFTALMDQYQSCRGSYQDVPAGEAMVSSVKRFNCRIQGGSDCQ